MKHTHFIQFIAINKHLNTNLTSLSQYKQCFIRKQSI